MGRAHLPDLKSRWDREGRGNWNEIFQRSVRPPVAAAVNVIGDSEMKLMIATLLVFAASLLIWLALEADWLLIWLALVADGLLRLLD